MMWIYLTTTSSFVTQLNLMENILLWSENIEEIMYIWLSKIFN